MLNTNKALKAFFLGTWLIQCLTALCRLHRYLVALIWNELVNNYQKVRHIIET